MFIRQMKLPLGHKHIQLCRVAEEVISRAMNGDINYVSTMVEFRVYGGTQYAIGDRIPLNVGNEKAELKVVAKSERETLGSAMVVGDYNATLTFA